jgi:hypothetical protein
MTRPFTSSVWSRRVKFISVTCPSYSSPWLPATRRTRGPSPLRIEVTGIGIQP